MNYPDNFNQALFDKVWGGDPDRDCPDAMKELDAIHSVYEDVLAALVASCKKHRVMPSYLDFQAVMEAVGEAVADEADAPLSALREAGYQDFTYTPEGSSKMVALAYEAVVNELRLRPISTNPATYAQADANRPVGVKSGDAVQFINRE